MWLGRLKSECLDRMIFLVKHHWVGHWLKWNRMFFTIAEQDSNAFRVIHNADVAGEPLRLVGIRLAAGTWDNMSPKSGDVEVLWKRLKIRMEGNWAAP